MGGGGEWGCEGGCCSPAGRHTSLKGRKTLHKIVQPASCGLSEILSCTFTVLELEETVSTVNLTTYGRTGRRVDSRKECEEWISGH